MKGGLLLLTGGMGSRMGSRKQDLLLPSGATWGSHLVFVFQSVFPAGPVQVLGEAVLDRPELQVVVDVRQGPAAALRHWATTPAPGVDTWWVVACDQVRWCEADFRIWTSRVEATDPDHLCWVIACFEGHLQPLGGWLPHRLRPALAQAEAHSLLALVESLPHRIVESSLPGWRDVDTPEDRNLFEGERG